MFEFNEEAECPFCGESCHACLAFDQFLSPVPTESFCNNPKCEKSFWVTGNYEISVDQTFKNKPRLHTGIGKKKTKRKSQQAKADENETTTTK